MSVELISGNQLKILLKRKGIKINDLVAAFNMNRISVSRYLNGHNPMTGEFVIKVAAYAGLSLNDLIEGKIETYKFQADHSVAAEADIIYESIEIIEEETKPDTPAQYALPEPEYKNTKNNLITIDTSKVEAYLEELQKKIDMVQQEVIDL